MLLWRRASQLPSVAHQWLPRAVPASSTAAGAWPWSTRHTAAASATQPPADAAAASSSRRRARGTNGTPRLAPQPVTCVRHDPRAHSSTRSPATASLADCVGCVTLAAAPGSSWPAAARTAFTAAAERLGGFWLLCENGVLADGHDRTGQPARGVLHVAVLGLPEGGLSFTHCPQPTLLRAPQPGNAHRQVFTLGAFELDDAGWPTSRATKSLSQFVARTSRAWNEPVRSLKVVWGDQQHTIMARETLKTWLRRVVIRPADPSLAVSPVQDRSAAVCVRAWYTMQLRALGVEVTE